jgi:hypothetical protein
MSAPQVIIIPTYQRAHLIGLTLERDRKTNGWEECVA